MTDTEKKEKRSDILDFAKTLLGVRYRYGAVWSDLNKRPDYLDCNEFIRGIYAKHDFNMPDGPHNQFEYCKPVSIAYPGDLYFLRAIDAEHICHVGMLFDSHNILEARGDPFGKVLFVPRGVAEKSSNFKGWRCHPELYLTQ